MTRTAVIGVGAMGRHHARIYRQMPETELVAVADADAELGQSTAQMQVTRAYTDHRQMIEEQQPEAVTVAVPTHLHHEVVSDALQAGCHVMVEKPIAATVEQGQQLIDMARDVDRVLAVGHVERYNPAVIELRRRLMEGELGHVFQVHTRRLGPFPARVRDVGVVVDLATHDLDIMRHLTGSRVVRLYAETKREVHTSNEDLFSGTVRFADDTLGVLEINWLTPAKIRELWVTGERGMFKADLLTQDLYFFENAEAQGTTWNTLSTLRGVSEGAMMRYAFARKEPLRSEQEAFIAAVNGDPSQIVPGQDGLAALKLALAMVQSGQEHQVLEMDV